MAILVRINGNDSGEGFLVVSNGGEDFPVAVGLRTDDGTTVNATLQMAPGGASVVLSETAVTISPVETFVDIHATGASAARNDTVLQVLVAAVVQASFNLTAVADPQILFRGRFQSRFATDGDPYNHATGGVAGWTWTLAGEPDFVPADSVADSTDKPVGRVIRFNNPIAPRSHTPPVATVVTGVRALVGGSPEDFTAGDPVIGMPVNVGPNTYFAGNAPKKPADPAPAEIHTPTNEPMALFELRIGNVFTGKPATLADRPAPTSKGNLSAADQTKYGIVPLTTFNANRKADLIAAFNALSPADQAATVGLNLKTRIGHLGGDAGLGVPADTPTLGQVWTYQEQFTGTVNDSISFTPNDSTVLRYMARFASFAFGAKLFNFHSDDMCGQVDGSVAANTAATLPPLQNGIYNVTTADAAAFHVLNAAALTEANVDAALGAMPAADTVVVSVGGTYDRLVVSQVVVANPADPPASWTIASRGESYVFDFQPDASVFPRDLLYAVLPPNHERNHLGNCEGTLAAPAPAIGFARLFYDGTEWKLLLHVGTEGAAGTTMKGTFSGATATIPDGCVPADLELLTPTIDFGSIEQGLAAYRQVVLLNRSAGPVDVTLPVLPAPFGAPGASTVTIQPGEVGAIGVSFTAGAPGMSGPTPATLTTLPIIPATLDVTFVGTSLALTAVDIVLVLDRSGSMAEPALQAGGRFISKAELRGEAAQVLVDLLRDGDRIGMVRFNQAAQPHMAIEEAGVPVTGMGRVNAANALASADLASQGSTSVGDGLIKGDTLLAGPTTSSRKAIVVLTDGVENRSPWINSVSLASDVRAYAIGLGQPQNINVDKLSAITGNTGGYLLVTGELDEQNEFRLHKYFTQILAGISGDSIVVDPRSMILPGDVQRTAFYISEADAQFDAVLLDRFPALRFRLEMPDGTVIDPASAGAFGGAFVEGRACRYYRMRPGLLPDPQRAHGKWHMVVEYPGNRVYRGAFKRVPKPGGGRDPRGRNQGELSLAVAYNVLVAARSAIKLDAWIDQRTFGADSPRRIVAHLTAFGVPHDQNVNLVAQVTRPDGIVSIVPLARKGSGRFEADLDDSRRLGLYSVVVRAAGTTPGGWALQREQTLSGVVIDPAALGGGDVQRELADVLKEHEKRIEELAEEIKQALAGLRPAFPSWLAWWLILVLILLLVIAWSIGF